MLPRTVNLRLDPGTLCEEPAQFVDGGAKQQQQEQQHRPRRQVHRGAPRLYTAERAENRRDPQQAAEDTAARKREARRQEEARGRELAGAGAMRLGPEERQMRQLANLIDVLRQAMAHRSRKLYGKTVRDWKGVFALIDRNGTGSVTQAEFKSAMRRMGLGLSDQQVEEIMLVLDPDGTGGIEFHELQRVLAMNWAGSRGAPAGAFGTPRVVDAKNGGQAQRQAPRGALAMEGDFVADEEEGGRQRQHGGRQAWAASETDEKMVVVARYQHETGLRQHESLDESSVTALGAEIAEEEMALQLRVAQLERDRKQLEDRKIQQQLRKVERSLRSHATTELRTFESTVKTELESQIGALNAERAEKLAAIVNFQNDLREKVRQLQQMIGECDTKATGVATGYDECTAALRDDFAKTLAAEREAVELQVHRMMQQLAKSPGKLAQAVSRIDSGVALRGPGSAGHEPLFAVPEAPAAAERATDGPVRVMASPVKTKLQQVFEEYSRPRRPATGAREGDSTTAEEDTEEEGGSKYSM